MHIQSVLSRFALVFLPSLLFGFQSNLHAEINLNDSLWQTKGIQLQLLTVDLEDELGSDINFAFNSKALKLEYYKFKPSNFDSHQLIAIYNNALTTQMNNALSLNSSEGANLKFNHAILLPSNDVAIMLDDDL